MHKDVWIRFQGERASGKTMLKNAFCDVMRAAGFEFVHGNDGHSIRVVDPVNTIKNDPMRLGHHILAPLTHTNCALCGIARSQHIGPLLSCPGSLGQTLYSTCTGNAK